MEAAELEFAAGVAGAGLIAAGLGSDADGLRLGGIGFDFPILGRRWLWLFHHGWRGEGEEGSLNAAGRELSFQLVGSPGEACFLVEEVGEDFAFHQSLEGEGDDLGVVGQILDEGLEFGLSGELDEFAVEELGFEGGDAMETPAKVGEFGDDLLAN